MQKQQKFIATVRGGQGEGEGERERGKKGRERKRRREKEISVPCFTQHVSPMYVST